VRNRKNSIGFMQGRLSPLVAGRIQAFPADYWKDEFAIASYSGITKMEWTIDSIDFNSNPILTKPGQIEINNLKSEYKIEIPSVTCDYFMENPPWKNSDVDVSSDVQRIIMGMNVINSNTLVIPLVDNSSLKSIPHIDLTFFLDLQEILSANKVKIAFEMDLDPDQTANYIQQFPRENFGINYDIGNSAALGYDPSDELDAYGDRIINVHVKDRSFGRSTVRLGDGDADFETVTRLLSELEYQGNYILQTARSIDESHLDELNRNIDYFEKYLINEI
jgi:L-ribulose-5-phosphate 3-epimerase